MFWFIFISYWANLTLSLFTRINFIYLPQVHLNYQSLPLNWCQFQLKNQSKTKSNLLRPTSKNRFKLSKNILKIIHCSMGPFIQIIIIQQMTAINCSELESNLVSPNLTSINLIKSSKKDWGPYLILDIQ